MYLPTEPIRKHVRALQAQGLTYPIIAARSGINVRTLENIMAKDWKRTVSRTAEAILAVTAENDALAMGRLVPYPSQRRIGALTAIGYTLAELGVYCDVAPNVMVRLMRKDRVGLDGELAVEIARVYDELKSTPSTDVRAKRYATQHEWPPPEAYEDWELDDPDPLTTARVFAEWKREQGSTFGSRLFDAREAAGMHLKDVAQALGVTYESVAEWEHDRAKPKKLEVRAALAKVLECDPDWLWNGEVKKGRRSPAAGSR